MSDADIAREAVAAWMMVNSYPTGHGDTLDDLLGELVFHAKRHAFNELIPAIRQFNEAAKP